MTKDPMCGMEVDKADALKVRHNGDDHFFCSEHCMKKFADQHGIAHDRLPKKSGRLKGFLKNKTVIVSAVLFALCALSYVVPLLVAFRESLFMYLHTIWWAILLGLLLGGVMDQFVPREYISHLLASPGRKTIINAVVLGFFMSVCSHGILALAIELHKKGASTPSVVAFLLASPWANVPLTIMLIGFFGIVKALYIVLIAIVIALTTGFIYQGLELKGIVEKNKNSLEHDRSFSVKDDLKKRFKNISFSAEKIVSSLKGVYQGAVSLSNMVLWWILIGMGLASLAGAYVPENIFQQYLGPTLLGMIITLLVATVLEVCSEGTAPLAFEIYRQTAAVGNSFVFLMAGVATDYTEIGLLWHNVGRKTAIILPLVTVPQVIFWGVIANMIF